MTSVSNVILCRSSSSFIVHAGRFARRAGVASKNRGKALSPHVSSTILDAGNESQRRSFSAHKITTATATVQKRNGPPAVPSVSSQRRLRSALPDEYYDDHGDVVVSPILDTTSTTSSSTTMVSSMASSQTLSKPFLLADIGEGIAEVELLRWFVEEGQVISEFDPVCEVQSDKATVEITSRFDGKIQKLAHSSSSAGKMIKVGEPILWILEEGDDGSYADHHEEQDRLETTINQEGRPAATSSDSSDLQDEIETMAIFQESGSSADIHNSSEKEVLSSVSSKVLTSPAVRKLARDNGLNLSSINGTGPSGRILKGDILAFLKAPGLPNNERTQDASSTINKAEGNEIHHDYDHAEESDPSLFGENRVVPLRGYNRIMADTMAASLQIPHMVYSDEINLNRFVKYKLEQQQLDHNHNRLQQEENSKKLLFLPLAIKAASKALEKYPWLNASFDEDKYEATLWKDHNIGIAMDTPRGLIVPVIKECQTKSLPELAEELQRLKEAVVDGAGGLPAEDLKGATFTLSNVGAIGGGGTYMSPIITPPQVAIGALGQIRRLPRFVTPSSTDPAQSQTIEEAHICAVSWAADHRVVDGATVARFHKSFKEYMEDPIKLLLELR